MSSSTSERAPRVPTTGLKKYVLIRRRPDLDQERFSSYWRGPHARLLADLPEFWLYAERYIQNHAVKAEAFANPDRWAGLVENWQTDEILKGRSFADEAVYGQVVSPDELRFVDVDSSIGFVAEAVVQVDGGAHVTKVIEPVGRDPGRSDDEVLDAWRTSRITALRAIADDAVPGGRFVENRIRTAPVRTLSRRPVESPYLALGEFWFPSPQTAAGFFRSIGSDRAILIDETTVTT